MSATRFPSYRLHKPSRQAVVTIGGRDYYLGAYASPQSREKYDRLIAEWLAAGRQLPIVQRAPDLTVTELCARFWIHAESFYRHPDGTPTSEVDTFKQAIAPLKALYGSAAAADFTPMALRAVAQKMIQLGWCRKYINQQLARVKHIFKWGVGQTIVPAAVHQALLAVAGLKKGKTDARESTPVKPVSDGNVDATIEYCSRQVATMIRLQLVTGMRPDEVCSMRRDIDTTGKLWTYTPAHHKTEHHGHTRTVYFGPQAQELVRPFLKPDLDAYLFSPIDAEQERREDQHAERIENGTPLSCGNAPGSHRHWRAERTPGQRYTVASYRRAIARACAHAFPLPPELARGCMPGEGRKVKSTRWETDAEWAKRLGDAWPKVNGWRNAHRWHPHQLRHTAATRLRKQFGLEAAQVILGHKTLSVTQVYAEKNVEAAQRIMAEVG